MLVVEMVAVDSSSIDAVGYDEGARELWVRFVDSETTYVYEGVEPGTYRELLEAESKGQFVNWVVKPRYSFRRL